MQGPADLPLRDIHLPEPVSWWPLAPGWWMVAVLLVLSLLGYWIWRHRRASRQQRPLALAQAELERLVATSNEDGSRLITALSAWLRRVCLAIFPDRDVAGLTGSQWLAFLDEAAGQELFSNGPGQVIADAVYRPSTEADPTVLLDLCRRWLAALPLQSANQSKAGATS